MSELTIHVESFKRVDLISVDGRVDSESAPKLDATFEELAGNGRFNYAVNLSEVSYMSSAGLRAIVSASKAAKKNGGELCLSKPSDAVAGVLQLAGLSELFQTYESDIHAVGSY